MFKLNSKGCSIVNMPKNEYRRKDNAVEQWNWGSDGCDVFDTPKPGHFGYGVKWATVLLCET